MSNNHSVVVLTPHGRRNTVKCNSNTTILQILEQTCTKFDFQPEEYDLTHHKHALDMSSTFRFSGLPNNAFLEMVPAKTVRKESDVVLGLQLENGERVMGNFTPSTDLLSVITSLVPDQCAPETNPVVIYTRREVYGEDTLKSTTLKSLGLTGGKAMLRLIHRTPEQLKTQANVSSPLISKPKESEEISFNSTSIFSSTKLNERDSESEENFKTAVNSTDQMQSCLQTNNVLNDTLISDSQNANANSVMEKMDTADSKDLVGNENTASKMETDTTNMSEVCTEVDSSHLEDEIVVLGEHNALVFSLDMSSQLPYNDLPDDFYDLSINEVRKLFHDLVQKRQEMENTPLQIAAAKKLEEDRRVLCQLKDYKKVVLRVAFPDRTVLQGTFRPLDTIKTIMDFVKSYLERPDEPFDLYLTPPKQILSPETRLVEAQCVPSAMLHFGPCVAESELPTTTRRRYLKKEILDKLTSPEAARFCASKTRGISTETQLSPSTDGGGPSTSNSQPKEGRQQSRSQPFSVPGPSKARDTKVPKWFKPS